MRRVCVFTGSSPGAQEAYARAATSLGRELAAQGLTLVYGGARVGLMGRMADAVLAHGGEVIGVIPQAIVAREVAHDGLTELRVVGSMHERKATMAELSDAFVAMPGGLGTLDEFFEVLTWAQLGLHRKPCALLDVAGYYAHLLAFLEHAVSERFVRAEHAAMVIVEASPQRLLERIRDYRAPVAEKWLDRKST